MKASASVDILVFSCVGREHLLARTAKKLRESEIFAGARRILVLDGVQDLVGIPLTDFDLVIQQPKRVGYVKSIINALPIVSADYIFWLEDDWSIENISAESIKLAIDTLSNSKKILQVRWPKSTEVAECEAFAEGLLVSDVLYSANPSVLVSSIIKDAFRSLSEEISSPRGLPEKLGFETFVGDRMTRLGIQSLVFDPKVYGTVDHLGEVESTDRKWHYVGPDSSFMAGTSAPNSSEKKYSVITLFARFSLVSVKTLLRMPFQNRYAELAFRFVQAHRT
jgi:hypothetical protein